jgi:hypothetical protein
VNLSPHFTFNELIVTSQPGFRDRQLHGGLGVQASLVELCREILEPIRVRAGEMIGKKGAEGAPIRVTSGYRHPDLNEALGGSRTGQHPLGEAADIQVPAFGTGDAYDRQMYTLWCWIKHSGLLFGQAILERNSEGHTWIHVSKGSPLSARPLSRSRQMLSAFPPPNYVTWDPAAPLPTFDQVLAGKR